MKSDFPFCDLSVVGKDALLGVFRACVQFKLWLLGETPMNRNIGPGLYNFSIVLNAILFFYKRCFFVVTLNIVVKLDFLNMISILGIFHAKAFRRSVSYLVESCFKLRKTSLRSLSNQ